MKHVALRRTLCASLVLIALILVLAASGIGSSLAYFTAYDTAKGAIPVNYSNETEFHEDPEGLIKKLSITNTGFYPIFVRAKGLGPAGIALSYSGTGWSLGNDGYCYYAGILQPGQTTETLVVDIKPGDYNADFEITVVEESTPVLYDADGEPYANWVLEAVK